MGRIAEGAVMLSHHLPGLLVTEQPIEGLPGAVPGAELVIRESSKLPPVGGWVVLDRGPRLEIAEVKFRPPC